MHLSNHKTTKKCKIYISKNETNIFEISSIIKDANIISTKHFSLFSDRFANEKQFLVRLI